MIAARLLLFMSVLTGLLYPVAVTLVARVVCPQEANGSLRHDRSGEVIGSDLIGQGFARPEFFWTRPSSVDYDAMNSGGSQLAPSSADLRNKVAERAARGATLDLLFASGSGLDPHISPAGALAQVDRVARARGREASEVRALVLAHVEPRQFGWLGEPRVNVLRLNQRLEEK